MASPDLRERAERLCWSLGYVDPLRGDVNAVAAEFEAVRAEALAEAADIADERCALHKGNAHASRTVNSPGQESVHNGAWRCADGIAHAIRARAGQPPQGQGDAT